MDADGLAARYPKGRFVTGEDWRGPPLYSPNSGTKGRVALEGSAGGVGAGVLLQGGGNTEDRVTPGALSVTGTSSLAGMLWERGASTALCQPCLNSQP